MAQIHFTPQMRRMSKTPQIDGPAAALREALDAAFKESPRLRGYLLDDGVNWRLSARGMGADFMPEARAEDENIQGPHLIAPCAGPPEQLRWQHHNRIWNSNDNAIHWERVGTAPVSSCGCAVVVHPTRGNTTWFVHAIAEQTRVPAGAALIVSRTTDGGQSFETLRNGLRQADCYDLIYRHALCVDATGQRLLLGSTTGSCSSSDDSGDRWHPVAAQLPPIHATCTD